MADSKKIMREALEKLIDGVENGDITSIAFVAGTSDDQINWHVTNCNLSVLGALTQLQFIIRRQLFEGVPKNATLS